VSWAWGLPPPGRVTQQFAPGETDITHTINGVDLQAGDALNLYTEHIVLFVSWADPGRVANLMEEPGCSSSIPYAHAFTSDVTISGSTVYVSYLGMTMQAIRYSRIVQDGTGSVGVPPAIANSYGPCSYSGKHGSCLDMSAGCPGGQFRSSAQGATGCQNFANNIKCCLGSPSLLGDEYSNYQSGSGAGQTSLAVIIGAVVAAVVVLAIIAGIAVFIFKRRQDTSDAIMYSNSAYSMQQSSTRTAPQFL